MIIEQAFMALPEFLVGAPYLKYDNEGTLAMAFSMAVLQELNGRSVPNPISSIRGEVHYPTAMSRSADLHCSLKAIDIATPELRTYGYRDQAWLEAKFFRRNPTGKTKIPGTTATLDLFTDLLRLSSLPPETPGPSVTCGRYLLHAYQGDHHSFLIATKKANKAKPATANTLAVPARPKFTRAWTRKIVKPGLQRLSGFRTADEAGEFDKSAGHGLRGIGLDLKVTNFVHSPSAVTNTTYLLVLTRFESVKVTAKVAGIKSWFEVDGAGVRESAPGALLGIQTFVSDGLA